MENQNNFIEGEKIESKNTYQTVGEIKTKTKKSEFSFGKQVLVPFISGVVGASVVIGSIAFVPEVKNLFNTNLPLTNTTGESTNKPSENTSLISLTNFSETGVAVAKKVLPSVVGIKVEYSVSSIFNKNLSSTATAEGSGIIISEDGYILTNNHIINSSSSSSYYEVGKANKVTVTLYNDETEYEGTIVGTDEQTDLAVIKIDKTGLTAAELGNSDSVQVGEFAMAVRKPFRYAK